MEMEEVTRTLMGTRREKSRREEMGVADLRDLKRCGGYWIEEN
jgi:hypothetical protein